MYKFKDIKNIHFEITSNCQASCPMCARNYHGGLDNPNLEVTDISVDFFKQICSNELLNQLKDINFCGNFGDPIIHKDFLEIVEYIVSNNLNIELYIHTNGSARTTQWWIDLAKLLPKTHIVYFGIDGLENTHELYRVGTSFNKIIENATAFINAGGIARWNFITFKHNEHQLEKAKQLSKELGFESFQEKQTSRFIGDPWFNVLDSNGNVTHKLEQPREQKIIFVDKETVKNYKSLINTASITCQVEEQKSVYVDARGNLWPCCFVGATPYIYYKPTEIVYNYQKDSVASLNRVIDLFGGLDRLNLRNRSIEEIVNSDEWQTLWDAGFSGENKLYVCARTCGKFDKPVVSSAFDQFISVENFNK